MAHRVFWILTVAAAIPVVLSAAIPGKEAVCTTQQCTQIAKDILYDMNPQADPCQDFNEFACGGFNSKSVIPPDQSAIDHFSIDIEKNQLILRSILDVNSSSTPKPSSGDDDVDKRNLAKLQALYSSCMDEDRINQVGRKPLQDEIQTVLKLFPISEGNPTSEQTKTSLAKMLAYLNHMGIPSFVMLTVVRDLKDPSKNSLMVLEGGLGLPAKEYYAAPAIMTTYETTIRDMFTLVLGEQQQQQQSPPSNGTNAGSGNDTWSEVAKSVVDFETQLAGIASNTTDTYDISKMHNPMTVSQLASSTPSVDWPLLMNGTLPEDVQAPETVIVVSPSYQIRLETFLQQASPKALQNYFVWSVIHARAVNLGSEFRQPILDLSATLIGSNSTAAKDRWKGCVAIVDSNIGELSGHYYVKETFTDQIRDQIREMIESTISTYSQVFPNLNWLNKITVDGAIKKLKAIVALIGYSHDKPNDMDPKSLDEYYKDFRVEPDDYYGNEVRALAWASKMSYSKLKEPVNKKDTMGFTPPTVNAFYNALYNQIYFLAGILQPPFFHADNPEYVNYGAIGMIAAHEVTHGFDNNGHLFDSEGRLADWWTNTTTAAFNERAQCFVDQYSNFTIKGADGKDYHVNGKLTLPENIADNGGLKQAFNTWQTRYKDDKGGLKNQRLPGLEKYSPEQIFFISFARLWCSVQTPELFLLQILVDPHSPAKYRINGAIQNSVQFANAFNCPANAPMNPTKKCELW
ncbi:hypothetical protein EMPS_07306 [Entomortierella parvispora]|uniref:Uncharacterized protein n=1 Tax=Entomortierella parvispora TaxID=205924 RepID=A0A9P3LYB4_9FUNG|nr:hypothetical protein EMPS_07306 [Entomortierella parvispora]